ncbi:hypothetical protein RHSP_06709 [Rhizobium freirei PRF 81]|uniref:Uncharacterized protein n=1 Tax=Rhizobium freirei PRF 81 TaxID=363754 RepID=N6U5P7_9HYPH|nr:hypothetical protein [Rhizobium freirei]ENN85568.1 hypothetical protein RHSP_06709 [Rhizobium freirei PRF 81]
MSVIDKAAAATTAIQDQAGKALDVLQYGFNGRIVNGFDIYTDPSGRHSNLLEARKAIDPALELMKATKWPTEAEYAAAEQA